MNGRQIEHERADPVGHDAVVAVVHRHGREQKIPVAHVVQLACTATVTLQPTPRRCDRTHRRARRCA
jgi:hypothetical protein